jgi:4'-phosphopantetheinyl transferase EntD
VPIDPQFDPLLPNPAVPSADIAELFPEGVAAAELRTPGDPSLLYPEESVSVAKAVPRRVREFAAGRLCARRALGQFGITGFALRAGADRVPRWPESIVGNITHTAGFCAAAVAERRRFQALGLDVEVVDDLDRELWPRICVRAELEWLESLPAPDQIAAAALIFSAKEAFYKCRYPVTGERLNFADLSVDPLPPGAFVDRGRRGTSIGTLMVRPTRILRSVDGAPAAALPARYRFNDRHVAVGICLPAAAPAPTAAHLQ